MGDDFTFFVVAFAFPSLLTRSRQHKRLLSKAALADKLAEKGMEMERKMQGAVAELALEKEKSRRYMERIKELAEERTETATQQKQREELAIEKERLKFEGRMVEVKLEVSKLQYKAEYLEMTVKQQQKELEVNRLQTKEYLKSCNSLFKSNTSVVASREKQQIRYVFFFLFFSDIF